jgi:hypothetical protein
MIRVPSNIAEAVEACILTAQKRHPQLSIERIADRCGETKWNIYKWQSSGSIPSQKVPTFEHATAGHFVTQGESQRRAALTLAMEKLAAERAEVVTAQPELELSL